MNSNTNEISSKSPFFYMVCGNGKSFLSKNLLYMYSLFYENGIQSHHYKESLVHVRPTWSMAPSVPLVVMSMPANEQAIY